MYNTNLKNGINQSNILLLVTLVLSIFTYLWHPLEYPTIGYTDGTSMRRAMHFLTGHGLQDPDYAYDHPFFAQIFLGGVLRMMDYPNSVHPTAQGDVVYSTQMLWMVPKVLIGVMAIIDTFLIYKIAERRYNTKVAFIAAILFAVFPVEFLRTTYFESIQLPFILGSIFFALNSANIVNKKNRSNVLLALLSGVLLGLAIFTKIPAFTMIPVVGFIIYRNNKSLRLLGIWFIPVVLIPLVWPSYALLIGEIDLWWDGIFWQTHRQETSLNFVQIEKNNTLFNAIIADILKMPILFVLGFAGFVFAAIRKDFFLILWIVPFLSFLFFIGFVRDFHLIPILPPLCICAAVLIVSSSNKITHKRVKEVLPFVIISSIAVFGIVNLAILYTSNNNNNSFAMSALVTRYLQDNRDENITVISSNDYSWIPRYVFSTGSEYMIPEVDVEQLPRNDKVLIVVNHSVRLILNGKDAVAEHLRNIYDQHSQTGTAVVQIAEDKIILPQTWPNIVSGSNRINIMDNNFTWMPEGNVTVLKGNNNLSIVFESNTTRDISNNVHAKIELGNITKSPPLLYLEYVSNSSSPKKNIKYFVEIIDREEPNTVYFMNNLRNTSGKLAHNLFILPKDLVAKQLDFRFGVNSELPGEHLLTLKKANIMYGIPR